MLILVVLPLALDIFRLNLVGKYLTYAFVALGLVLCWGNTGILSLGQGVFFGLGGYCMAMFLKLEASSVANTKIQSTPGIPDFMDWNQLTALPLLLGAVQVAAVRLDRRHRRADDPGAFIVGFAMFKRRVGGVYFAIITQALAAVMTILIVGQQGYTGGINGITDLRTLLGWDIRTDSAKYILYFVCCVLLLGSMLLWPLRARQQARPHPGRDARQGGSRPLLRLRRRQLQDLRVLPGRRRWRRSAARCSPCRSGSCRRPSSASCRRSRWSSSARSAAGTPASARSSARSSSTGPRRCFPRRSRSSGCSRWAALFIAVVLAFPRGLAGLVTDSHIWSPDRRSASACRQAPGRNPGMPRRRHRVRPNRGSRPMASNTDFLLASKSVTVSFDGFKAVDDLNLYIDEDEMRVIIGPNGAGKTTVLDLICGRTKAHRGRSNSRIRNSPASRSTRSSARGIGRKFQTPSIYEDLTVFENLEISFPRGRNVVRRAGFASARR